MNFMAIFKSATRIALLGIILTVCLLAIGQIPVSDQFQSIAQSVVAFFFGTKAAVHNSLSKKEDSTTLG